MWYYKKFLSLNKKIFHIVVDRFIKQIYNLFETKTKPKRNDVRQMENNLEQRRDKILEMLSNDGKVEVSQLSELFGVSGVMIRRDLTELEKRGLLTRIHGGAVSSYKTYYNMSFSQRSGTNETEKKALASYIANIVEDNDTIMMNAGTTMLYVFRALAMRKNISIVTNSIAVALDAAGNENFNVVLLGGSVNTKYQFTFGDDAQRQLQDYHVDKLILSVDGVSASDGLSTYYNQEAYLCRQMIAQAGTSIVVADYTKIGRNTFVGIAPLDAVDCLVTNENASKTETSAIEKLGVQVALV